MFPLEYGGCAQMNMYFIVYPVLKGTKTVCDLGINIAGVQSRGQLCFTHAVEQGVDTYRRAFKMRNAYLTLP